MVLLKYYRTCCIYFKQLSIAYSKSCLSLKTFCNHNTFYGAHSQLERTFSTVLTILQVLHEKRRAKSSERRSEKQLLAEKCLPSVMLL